MRVYTLGNRLHEDAQIQSVAVFEEKLCIPFDADNMDYQQFKKDIAAGAELQDAEGNTMTAQDAQAFVATLP